MSGHAGDTTFSASGKPGRRDVTLTLGTAQSMVPLVSRIVHDIAHAHDRLAALQPEQDRLDRRRHDLSWPERSRRYQLREEIVEAERHFQGALAELATLGVALLDLETGRIGFPTVVNDRRAFFAWKPGQETLSHWHYAGENALRLIPAAWREPSEARAGRKR